MALPAALGIGAFFTFIAGLAIKIAVARFVIKLLILVAGAALTSVFLTEITSLLPTLNVSTLHPVIQKSIAFLPPNTSTYITICISAVVARWTFVSSFKALNLLV